MHTVDPVSKIKKYAEDTYLIMPASKVHTCANELHHIKDWVVMNNITFITSRTGWWWTISHSSHRGLGSDEQSNVELKKQTRSLSQLQEVGGKLLTAAGSSWIWKSGIDEGAWSYGQQQTLILRPRWWFAF